MPLILSGHVGYCSLRMQHSVLLGPFTLERISGWAQAVGCCLYTWLGLGCWVLPLHLAGLKPLDVAFTPRLGSRVRVSSTHSWSVAWKLGRQMTHLEWWWCQTCDWSLGQAKVNATACVESDMAWSRPIVTWKWLHPVLCKWVHLVLCKWLHLVLCKWLLLVEQHFICLSFPFVSVNSSHGKSGAQPVMNPQDWWHWCRLFTMFRRHGLFHVHVPVALWASALHLIRRTRCLAWLRPRKGERRLLIILGLEPCNLCHETTQPQQLVIHTMHTVLQFGAWGVVPSLFSFQLLWDL